MLRSGEDLSIDEVLQDPMINAVMRADRVTRDELRALLVSTARKGFGGNYPEGRTKANASGIFQAKARNSGPCHEAVW